MADLVDQAQKEEQRDTDESIYEAMGPPIACDVPPDMVAGEPHCARCGVLIPEARMHALPCTGLCARCAQDLEDEQARLHPGYVP